MSYDAKLSRASVLLDDFAKAAAAAGNALESDFTAKFLVKLGAGPDCLGATDDDSLRLISWEDIQKLGLPLLKAKQLVALFRSAASEAGTNTLVDTQSQIYVTERKAAQMSVAELLTAYDPREANHVAARLKTLSSGRPCIVFDSDGKVLVDASAAIIAELREDGDLPDRPYYVQGGVPRQILAVGQRPARAADVNPLFPDERLRPDGTCSHTNLGWNAIGKDQRIIVYLAVSKTHEISKIDNDVAYRLMEILTSDYIDAKLAQCCPKAVMEFNRLKETGNLPSLRVTAGGPNVPDGKVVKQDPFSPHKRS